MHNLWKDQKLFLKSILDNSTDLSFIKSDLAKERIEIYRNTIFENMLNSLSLTFPGTKKLLGKECFKSACFHFFKLQENMPKTGCIDFWGENFPYFFDTREEFSDLPYISDFARFEWLKHLAYISKENKAIKIEEIQKYDEREVNLIEFDFQESAYFYKSDFPIYKIEEMLSKTDSEAIDIDKEKSYAIILKDKILWLGKSYYIFAKSLKDKNISNSCSDAIIADSSFDISKALVLLFQAGLIVKAHVREEKYV